MELRQGWPAYLMMRSRRLPPTLLPLTLITLTGLILRLTVWHWREFYPLGGDEREYFDAALTLLREWRYKELLFMRPPLYPLFLAASIILVDSLVQHLRLVQALVSALTIPLIYLLTLETVQATGRPPEASRRSGLIAAALTALSYTLAANATELLAETLFLFVLTAGLWRLVRAGRSGTLLSASLAGLTLGIASLVRSMALPLLPLGGLWLLLGHDRRLVTNLQNAGVFILAGALVITPWTIRNYWVYGGIILIDTTGAENLWLDNDPRGREAVKRELFALGENRLERQRLAARNGLAVIWNDPVRFGFKAWGELLRFFALEHTDDMRARPQIWVRPADVWLRLILGDGLWLLVVLCGGYGLARSLALAAEAAHFWRSVLRSPASLCAAWALYVVLTTLVFHVEYRYRLPLLPALLPFAGLMLADWRTALTDLQRRPLAAAALLAPVACLTLTLLHANYVVLGWQLGTKHWRLGQAESALARGDAPAARRAAEAALARDPGSALARIALARADLLEGDRLGALQWLDAAVSAVPDHPQAHVLRGDVRRSLGDYAGARTDLAYETASLQDLQRWLWERSITPAPTRLDLGNGLDLGFIMGFHGPRSGEEGFRWTTHTARLRLSGDTRIVRLRLASGRPAGTAPVKVMVRARGIPLRTLEVASAWSEHVLELPPGSEEEILLELKTPTFMPRQFDRASPDGRRLGVKLAWVEGQP